MSADESLCFLYDMYSHRFVKLKQVSTKDFSAKSLYELEEEERKKRGIDKQTILYDIKPCTQTQLFKDILRSLLTVCSAAKQQTIHQLLHLLEPR